ncbi:MAG: hypothetical protein R3D29_12430 [Nitratireductor sp.]
MAYSGTALAQGIVVPAKMEIFDGVSKSSHKENGRLIVDDFYAIDSRFQLQTAGGKTICSGTRRQGNGGGTFAGKCFGYKARGNYTQDARGNVRMRWDYSNSWIKMNARVQ